MAGAVCVAIDKILNSEAGRPGVGLGRRRASRID